MKIKTILGCTMLVWLLFIPWVQASAETSSTHSDKVYAVTVDGEFDEYKELLELAISGRGIKISNTSHISDMLQRTREAVGASDDIFANAEAIEFCSANLSREMMKTNPNNILYCPYIIYIYEIAEESGVIHLAFRKLPVNGGNAERQALNEVNKMLIDIISETVE